MSDMGEMFRARAKMQQEKRASNREQSADLLRRAGIHFTSHNEGAHLIVEGEAGFWDFWPGTGRWSDRRGRTGFGVMNLIKSLGKGVIDA